MKEKEKETSQRPSFMYTQVQNQTPRVYTPLVGGKVKQGGGDKYIETGWEQSAKLNLSRSRSPIQTKFTHNEISLTYKYNDNKGQFEIPRPDEIAVQQTTSLLPYYGQAPILLTRYTNVRYNLGGIKYKLAKAEVGDSFFAIPNGVAQQVEVSTNAIIAQVTKEMKTDLAIVKNDEVKVQVGDSSAKSSVFPRFVYAAFQSSRNVLYAIIKLAVIRQTLMNEAKQNYYLADRVNYFLKELDRSRFVSAFTTLRKTLKIMIGHQDALNLVQSVLTVQKENDSLSNVYSITDLDIDEFLGLDAALKIVDQENWDLETIPEVEAINPVATLTQDTDLTESQHFLSYIDINNGNLPHTLSYDKVGVWAKALPDVEKMLIALYSDQVEINGKTYDYVKACEKTILGYIRLFKYISDTLPLYNSKFDDFLVAAATLPTNLTSKLVSNYELDDIFTHYEYVKQTNDFEALTYAGLLQWRKVDEDNYPLAQTGSLTDKTRILQARETLIDAIVPVGNDLRPLNGFDTNSILTLRNDYPGNEAVYEYKDGSKYPFRAKQVPVYEPIIEAKSFRPLYTWTFIPKDADKIMFHYAQTMDTIYPEWQLAQLEYLYLSDHPGIDSVIPHVFTADSIKFNTTDKEHTVRISNALTYGKWDMNILKYLQSTFLMYSVDSLSYVSEDTIGKDKLYVANKSVPYIHPATSGFRPVSYKPIDYKMIDMATHAVGLTPVSII